MDVASGDLRVLGENRLGALERSRGMRRVARSARGYNETCHWIVCVGHVGPLMKLSVPSSPIAGPEEIMHFLRDNLRRGIQISDGRLAIA